MNGHPMTLALAVRMAIWTIIAFLGFFGIVCALGNWLASISEDYPEPMDEALSEYSESDTDYKNNPPRTAA